MRWNPFRRKAEAKAADISGLLDRLLFGQGSKAGVPVNLDAALRVTTALACARVIAEGIAQLPKAVNQDLSDGRKKRQDRPPDFGGAAPAE
jgi:phage portal protein BeeE